MENEIFTVRLPDIGEGVVEGEVIEWLKNVGDRLQQDEPVVIVMTDKATVELPAPHPGVLAKQYYRAGEISIKDQPLYDIKLDMPSGENRDISKKQKELAVRETVSAPGLNESLKIDSNQRSLATPRVRGIAKELGIDIDSVVGSGKGGRVELEDIKRCCSEAPVKIDSHGAVLHLAGDEEKSLKGIPGLMAKKMAESHLHIPQFSFFESVEAGHLMQLKSNYSSRAASEGIQLSYMPFLIKALSLTILQYPVLNSSVDMAKSKLYIHKPHNIGIAMAGPQGLIVPVLKGVQSMHLEEVIHSYTTLKEKAAANALSPVDMKEATITITNFGVLGGSGMWATPIINYPEVAILGIARIRKEPVVRNQEVVARDMLPLSWSFDHRVIDGQTATAISHHFSTLVRDPAPLI